MTPWRRAAWAAAALQAASVLPASACELVLAEHRSGRELLRLPMAGAEAGSPPRMRIAFTHSVLGTPVEDLYEWRAAPGGARAHLVEERFEGQGYGLPHAAAAGQRLEQKGAQSRLLLDRIVDPLVMRPLPALNMRVIVDGTPARPPVLLGALSQQAIAMTVAGCTRP